MSKPKVYLAGPISGLTYEGATDWRTDVIHALADADIIGVSPMRGPEYLLSEKVIRDSYPEQALSTVKGITYRDRFDVMTCDVVLMHVLGATKVSIGTMIEAGWADAFRKPVVLAMEPGNVHQHGMLETIAGWIVPTQEEAVHIIKTMFYGQHDRRE